MYVFILGFERDKTSGVYIFILKVRHNNDQFTTQHKDKHTISIFKLKHDKSIQTHLKSLPCRISTTCPPKTC